MTAIEHGMTDADYHASPALSSTGARLLLPPSTPAHYRWYADNPPTYSDAFDLGTVAHTLILGTGRPIDIVYADDWRGKEARAARVEARAAGHTPILKADWDRAAAMRDAVMANPDAGWLLDYSRGTPEMSLFWTDDATGVECRARPDMWLPDSLIAVDLKTTAGSANPDEVGRSIAKFGYDVQAAWYLDGIEATGLLAHEATGTLGAEFVFVFVEKQPPHLVSVVRLAEVDLDRARAKAARAREVYRDCAASNTWPGYPAGVHTVPLPSWYAAHSEEITYEYR